MQQILNLSLDPESGYQEDFHPLALAAKADSQDMPNWQEAMSGPNKQGNLEACKKELHMLQEEKKAWDVVHREPWMKVLPSTWAFRCKR